jgi:putative sugar O-methyltransferase
MSFSTTQSHLYDKMVLENNAAGEPFTPSPTSWLQLSTKFTKSFKTEGIGAVEDQSYNHWLSCSDVHNSVFWRYVNYMAPRRFTQNRATNYQDAVTVLYEHTLVKDHNDVLKKTQASGVGTSKVFKIDGKNVSWDYLLSVNTVITLAREIPALITGRHVVADLGAGWGRVGLVLKQFNPQIAYVIFDIPEALLLSQTYLPTTLPTEKCLNYEDHTNANIITRQELLEQAGLRFCGTHHLPKFEDKSIDVLINIASMQEMNQNTIKLYFDLIDHKAQYFYTLQYNNVTKCNTGFKTNTWPYPSTWNRIMHSDNIFYWQEYFESLFRIIDQ